MSSYRMQGVKGATFGRDHLPWRTFTGVGPPDDEFTGIAFDQGFTLNAFPREFSIRQMMKWFWRVRQWTLTGTFKLNFEPQGTGAIGIDGTWENGIHLTSGSDPVAAPDGWYRPGSVTLAINHIILDQLLKQSFQKTKPTRVRDEREILDYANGGQNLQPSGGGSEPPPGEPVQIGNSGFVIGGSNDPDGNGFGACGLSDDTGRRSYDALLNLFGIRGSSTYQSGIGGSAYKDDAVLTSVWPPLLTPIIGSTVSMGAAVEFPFPTIAGYCDLGVTIPNWLSFGAWEPNQAHSLNPDNLIVPPPYYVRQDQIYWNPDTKKFKPEFKFEMSSTVNGFNDFGNINLTGSPSGGAGDSYPAHVALRSIWTFLLSFGILPRASGCPTDQSGTGADPQRPEVGTLTIDDEEDFPIYGVATASMVGYGDFHFNDGGEGFTGFGRPWPSGALVTLSNVELDLRPSKYWKFLNSLGQEVYDENTGDQVNDPFA